MLICKRSNTTAAAASALLIGLCSLSAHAATITVTTDSGPASLRGAIALAAAGDTIDFSGGLSGTILLGSTLVRDKTLTLLGNPGFVLDGSDLVRPVTVSAPQQDSLRELIIQRGAAGDGAGIFSAGSLSLTDVVLRDNHTSSRGGALLVNGGRLLRVAFSDNSAVADGGALMDVGTGASSISNRKRDTTAIGDRNRDRHHFGRASVSACPDLSTPVEICRLRGSAIVSNARSPGCAPSPRSRCRWPVDRGGLGRCVSPSKKDVRASARASGKLHE